MAISLEGRRSRWLTPWPTSQLSTLLKCVSKDRGQELVGEPGWTEHGGELPRVWPVRADPINVVMRNGKPRMTIDKSMRLTDRT